MNSEKVRPGEGELKELQECLLYCQAIESARCFEESVLRNVPNANIGSIFGIGNAPWTGGVLAAHAAFRVRAGLPRACPLMWNQSARTARLSPH